MLVDNLLLKEMEFRTDFLRTVEATYTKQKTKIVMNELTKILRLSSFPFVIYLNIGGSDNVIKEVSFKGYKYKHLQMT